MFLGIHLSLFWYLYFCLSKLLNVRMKIFFFFFKSYQALGFCYERVLNLLFNQIVGKSVKSGSRM